MDNFTRGYLACAVWADGGDADVSDIPDYLLQQSIADCAVFQKSNAELLAQYYARIAIDPSQGTPQDYAGHDFYLTRCRHGAGFWDRGLGQLGDKLTKAAHSYGNVDDFTLLNDTEGTA